MLLNFKKFILRGNMVELAVAFVIGAAFNSIVQSLVKSMITPLIAAVGGNPNFSNYYFTLNHAKFMYGTFIDSVISFLLIALTVFFLVIQPMNKLISISNKNKTPAEPTDKKCSECLSAIPKAASRCAFCGIKQKP